MKTEVPPKDEPKVTSYNEFIRRFYPDPEKPQLAKVDSSEKAKLNADCLFSR
jgi:hypothetical protein